MEDKKTKIKKPIKKGLAKVPLVMQLEALECGAACLTMILAYYDKWIALEQVRSDCGVSRDGASAKNILLAAMSYGLKVSGCKSTPELLKQNGGFPCIVHWEFNHFIVVNGFKGGKVYINDPARGTLALSEEEFDKGFTGICMRFEPNEGFEPEGSKKSMVSYARKRMIGAGPAVVFVIFTTIISSLMGIIWPGFSKMFIDKLLGGNNPEWVIPFFMAITLFTILQVLVAAYTNIYSLRINGKMAAVGNTTYLWKVLRMPMEFFSQRMSGDIQQRMATNAKIASTLVNTFAPLVINIGMMLFYLIVVLRYSFTLTIIGILSILTNIIVSRIISKKRVNIARVSMRDAGKLYGLTVSGIEMIDTIKASGAEDGFLQKWAGYQANVNTANIKDLQISTYYGLIPKLVKALTDGLIIILGVYFAITTDFTVGSIMAFQGFLTSFCAPVSELIKASQTITEMRTSMERVEDVMEYPTDVDYDDESIEDEDTIYSKLSGEIVLKDVTFGYSKLADPLIENFSMTLKRGSRIAFVGASGCGKSTLSKLISGLYKPWSGEILFDGKPISDIDRSVFTSSVSVVNQDITLFDDSISANIRMWDESIQDSEVIRASKDAMIHDDIMQRQDGYNYKILENGKDFSGGQRQRLEIARALAQDPAILILDEATSALDAKTECEVVKSINDRGITCIIVAHRLSTIRDCDEIIVLNEGKVVERGTHSELMALGGYYTELITNE